jgi:hypothetical protein
MHISVLKLVIYMVTSYMFRPILAILREAEHTG